jgi:hypothetical protein
MDAWDRHLILSAREGAPDNLAPGLAGGIRRRDEACGREGGRYNHFRRIL